MAVKKVFRRVEQKYLLPEELAEVFRREVEKHMQEDSYGETDIMNIYYDTPDHRLIRNSIDRPVYKEKLRVRCYGVPEDGSTAFIELKKKYDSVVYKRRLTLPYRDAVTALGTETLPDTQIGREIKYFCGFYKTLAPAMAISYHRKAYVSGEFRVTFDSNILYRTEDVDLKKGIYGRPVTDRVVMELKSSMGLPRWLLDLMSRHEVRKTGFSKYGTAYKLTKGEK